MQMAQSVGRGARLVCVGGVVCRPGQRLTVAGMINQTKGMTVHPAHTILG